MLLARVMPILMRTIGGTCFVAGSALFGSVGVYVLWRERRLSSGARAEGVIIGAEPNSGLDGIRWWPRVAFETPAGEKIEFVNDDAWNTWPEVGRKVQVEYLPERPAEAEIRSATPWVAGLVCVAFAILFAIAAVVFYGGLLGI